MKYLKITLWLNSDMEHPATIKMNQERIEKFFKKQGYGDQTGNSIYQSFANYFEQYILGWEWINMLYLATSSSDLPRYRIRTSDIVAIDMRIVEDSEESL